jgi:hypothetical protein
MRFLSKLLIVTAAIIGAAGYASGTVIRVWQPGVYINEDKLSVTPSSVSTFWDLHNNAHMDNLPVR